ncbi:hypothetical protein C4568_02470 [Candidatus Parcubacteria bacterium]|nr:MAG: hypothetical protein C4568_02470 [Candidatus Parcubacteria bacterium]
MILFFREHRRVLIALLFVLLIHQASFLYFDHLSAQNPTASAYPIFAGDSATYVEMSESLLVGKGLAGEDGALQRAYPPGYAAFLAVSKAITGSYTFAAIIQIFATLGAAFLIYLMTLKFVSRGWAIAAAMFYGLDPSVIFASTTLFSDALFSAMIVAVVYMLFFAERPPVLVRSAIAGFLLDAATLVRPIGEFLLIVLPVLFVILSWIEIRTRGRKGKIMIYHNFLPAVVCALTALIIVVPWVYRNYSIFGVPEIAHVGANNLLYYNARQFLLFEEMNTLNPLAALKAARAQTDLQLAAVDARIAEELEKATPPGQMSTNYEGAVAKRLLLEHPILYGYYHSVNIVPFFITSSVAAYQQYVMQARDSSGFYAPTFSALWQNLRDMKDRFATRDWGGLVAAASAVAPIALEMLFWIIVTLLAAGAVMLRWRDPRVILFALLVLYFAFLTGPVAIARYRIPAEPYLFILAGIALSALVDRIKATYGSTR